MSTHQPIVSIVTVNYNSQEVTCDFLRSIARENTYPNIEVIVVDNASRQDPAELFRSIYPDVIYLRNNSNLGFSGGNNAGIRIAKGEYIFMVNNDTEFTPGLLEGLLEVFQQYPDAGVVSPKFHYFYDKGTIEYAGYESVNIFTGRNMMVGWKQKDEGQFDSITQTNYGHGGGMMVPMRVIEEAGLLYEPFFLYYEELDWCEKIKRKGYKVYYQPKSLIYHKESMTTGKFSPLKTFYLTRNRILFMRRNVPLPSLMVFLLYFTFLTIPKNTLQFAMKKQKQHLRSFWKGILWHFNRKITFTL